MICILARIYKYITPEKAWSIVIPDVRALPQELFGR
jgi:hypothetical protein